jgi:signal recognition particle subunit SRP19
MLKERTKLVIWPVYLDATKSRSEGRILSIKDSIKSPLLKEIERAARELNLSPIVEIDKAYPKSWWDVSGRVLVDRKGPKSVVAKQIAQKISKIRTEK